MSQSVSNQVIRRMLGACQQQGGDPDAILMAGGLTSFDIEREQGRLLAHSHYRMLQLMQPYLASFHEPSSPTTSASSTSTIHPLSACA